MSYSYLRKRVFIFVIILLAFICSAAVADQSGKIGNLDWYLTSDGKKLTISGTGPMPDYGEREFSRPWGSGLFIEQVVIQSGVTSIGNYVFDGMLEMKSITIPSSVTRIGNYAFSCCYDLNHVDIPASVTAIGQSAFYLCSSLSQITIPKAVSLIGESPFQGCMNLENITVESDNPSYVSVEGVLYNKTLDSLIAFPAKSPITDYIIPDGVVALGDSTFASTKLLNSVSLPDSVTSIGRGCFANSTLKSIALSSNLTSIGSGAFFASGLESISIPQKTKSIESDALTVCHSLTRIDVEPGNTAYSSLDGVLYNHDQSVLIIYPERKEGSTYTIPKQVTQIEFRAFYSQDFLSSLTIPSGVVSIGSESFAECSKLTSLLIPQSVSSIHEKAFSLSEKLELVVYPDSYAMSFAEEHNVPYHIVRTMILPEDCVTIEAQAFRGSDSEAVFIDENCESIGSQAFAYCPHLMYVSVPAGVKDHIAGDAFEGSDTAYLDYQ